jgi:hypothetical protein
MATKKHKQQTAAEIAYGKYLAWKVDCIAANDENDTVEKIREGSKIKSK